MVKTLEHDLYRSLEETYHTLAMPLVRELHDRGISPSDTEVHRFLDIRPLGTDTYLSIPFADYEAVAPTFLEAYRRHFGFEPSNVPLELVNVRVEVLGRGGVFKETRSRDRAARTAPKLLETADVSFDKQPTPTPVYHRDNLHPGCCLDGPAVVVEDYSTVLIEPGFTATVNEYGHLVLEQQDTRIEKVSTRRDLVMLEVFNNLFMSVAEQMGTTLANTAHSTNIKERLDFSCAIFDRLGNLVANAPHIPVHLGAMSESVKAIIRANPPAGGLARRCVRNQQSPPRRLAPAGRNGDYTRLRACRVL